MTNVVGRIPIGALADRCDRRWLVSAGLACLALALAAFGQLGRLEPLLACAVVMGVGMSLIFTTLGALIAELVPALKRGLAMGMYNSCIYLGMMTGSTAFGLALKQVGYPVGFALAGGTSLSVLALFLVLMRSEIPGKSAA
jgi:MFS family permease